MDVLKPILRGEVGELTVGRHWDHRNAHSRSELAVSALEQTVAYIDSDPSFTFFLWTFTGVQEDFELIQASHTPPPSLDSLRFTMGYDLIVSRVPLPGQDPVIKLFRMTMGVGDNLPSRELLARLAPS